MGPREVREAAFGIKSLHDRPFHLRVLDLSLGLSLDETQLAAPLQPGEVRLVKVKVDPAGLVGPIKGAVRLGTDDPGQPNYILRYDMLVRPEVTVDAERKSFGEVAPHESPEQSFRFRREGGDPLTLVLTSETSPYLDVERIPGEGGEDLRVTLRPRRLKAGVTAGLEVLKVATNAPKQPLFTLYLDWRIALPVIPEPSRLVFTEPKTTLLALELRARDGKPFRILKTGARGAGLPGAGCACGGIRAADPPDPAHGEGGGGPAGDPLLQPGGAPPGAAAVPGSQGPTREGRGAGSVAVRGTPPSLETGQMLVGSAFLVALSRSFTLMTRPSRRTSKTTSSAGASSSSMAMNWPSFSICRP